MPKFIDLTGKQFGRITVIRRVSSKDLKTRWLYICECGKKKQADGAKLKNGHVKSCGCLLREKAAQQGRLHKRHGRAKTPIYAIWKSMKRRCADPKNRDFHRYGGRGISVCNRWIDSFENFLADMGERPPGKTIDRINNDGNYEPNNCEWRTRSEQGRNTSRNRMLTVGDTTLTLIEWSERTGINFKTIHTRLSQGWSVEAALSPASHHAPPGVT